MLAITPAAMCVLRHPHPQHDQAGDLAGFQYGGKLLRISAPVVAPYENADLGKAHGGGSPAWRSKQDRCSRSGGSAEPLTQHQ